MFMINANALLGTPNKVIRSSGSKIYMADRKGSVVFTNDDSVKLGSAYSDIISSDKSTKFMVQKGAIVNANYISQLFKKEVGTTFTDQLPVITVKNTKRN